MAELACRCDCGQSAWHVSEAGVADGTRLICYCNSCRAAHFHLRGTAQGLTEGQGVEILHIRPSELSFTQGASHLRAMRLSDKGILRWYVQCCNTPVANTLSNPRRNLAGVVLPVFSLYPQAPELGTPWYCNTKYRQAGSGAPQKDVGFATVAFHVSRRLAAGVLRSRPNAFTAALEAGRLPETLTKDARAQAYAQASAPL